MHVVFIISSMAWNLYIPSQIINTVFPIQSKTGLPKVTASEEKEKKLLNALVRKR